jgi:hypothetical protein
MKAAGKIGLLTIVSPVNRDRLVERDIKAACDKVVALPFALLSVDGRDADGTLAVRKKTKLLKSGAP